jgi:hypothetical protein
VKHQAMKACKSSVPQYSHRQNPTDPPVKKKSPLPRTQCTFVYPVFGLSVHRHKLPMTNDEGKK